MRLGKSYIPCLRWKKGEQLALQHLSSKARSHIIPFIEIAEMGFDFGTQKKSKSIDEHLKPFAKQVKDIWGVDECFVDLRLINTATLMGNGEHVITFIFNELRAQGASAIPVINILRTPEDQNALYQIMKTDNRGVCIRAGLENVTETDFWENIKNLVYELNIRSNDCDLILDLGAPPKFEPITGFSKLIMAVINDIPNLNNWRSFGIIGSSFPESLSGIKSGISYLPRNEWLLYKELTQNLKKSRIRIPTFGDYVINHPKLSTVDMRFVKLKANIRYALDNSWLIARGDKVRDYSEHKKLCNLIIKTSDYYGDTFSKSDKYIKDCAKGIASTGNPTIWRWIGTNHHLEVVSRATATFDASLNILEQ